MSAEQNASLGGIVESCQQFDDRGLASAVLAHDRHLRARWNGKRQTV